MRESDPLSMRQLAVFVALVDEGSFTKAARALQVSQSTVSGHIADLEKRVGLRLVSRARSGVRPTRAGESFIGPARQALNAELRARDAAAELIGLKRGALVIGASTIPAAHLLPPVLARFREAHPSLTLDVRTGDSAGSLVSLAEGSIDLAWIGAPPPAELPHWRVGEDHMVLIAPPGHPCTEPGPLSLQTVAELAFVGREAGSGSQSSIDALLRARLGDIRFNIVCRMGSTEAIKRAVRAGLGCAFVSDLAVADEVAAGHLVRVEVPELANTRPFHIVARSEASLGPAARAFLALTTGAELA